MVKDLFTFNSDEKLKQNAPLADRLRPENLDEFVGQQSILSKGRLLRRAIEADRVGNIILHGPPGVGKTTLAKIIAANTRSHFTVLNAVMAGMKEIRTEVELSRERLGRYGLKTILFLDEVHRFNSAQQDALLPWVENGMFALIGATTENPYFEVNKALLSRSTIFRMTPIESEDLYVLLKRALLDQEKGFGLIDIQLTEDAAKHLVEMANGDARSLLNALEIAVETTPIDKEGVKNIDLSIAEESIQERAVLYDKKGDFHYDTISAFIKSLRGSDPDASLFWMSRMLEAGENPRYIFRRMLIAASEDVGLADPQAIVVVNSCAAAYEQVGLPEGIYFLSQAALYLANTEKSNSVLSAIRAAQSSLNSVQNPQVPSHLRDTHRDQALNNNDAGYLYPHDFPDNWVPQNYLPEEISKQIFWNPTIHGWEGRRRKALHDRKLQQYNN